jgi:OPA family glycerol-3-phosphate transporter-like MFS transporter/OPA family sugar phosphate sensor protein UhpC-like MFS transporter
MHQTETLTEGRRWLPRWLQAPAAATPVTDPEQVRRGYAYFQPRILIWTTIGYGAFYFVRKNLSVALPVMGQSLGIGKLELGLFLTLHGVLYGLSKFANGVIGDRADGRKFMALGLAASAALNVLFVLCVGIFDSLHVAILAMGVVWTLNGWVQGMGYPPCARLLSHWFSPKELATKMSFWNASHSMGMAGVLILCGYLIDWTSHGRTAYPPAPDPAQVVPEDPGNWQLCFFVPAGIALAVAAALWMNLRDTPESVGLPEVEGSHVPAENSPAAQMPGAYRRLLWRRVFSDKYIWIVSAANFFVYVLRYALIDWGTFMLKEVKSVEIKDAAWLLVGFEVAGLAGMIATGWLTDRWFRGRGAPLCVICMMLAGLTVFLFWRAPAGHFWLNMALLAALGAFIYGPQALVAVIVCKLATKRAAATAVGLTSIFGYGSTVLSGWGMGAIVERWGWGAAFGTLIACAGVGTLLFAAALGARTDNYADSDTYLST